MTPLFFVQNNYVQRLTIPVARFAHAHGVALEDRSSTSDFSPADCGIDWSQYHPVLPYGSVQFVRGLKHTPLGRYIWHDEVRFSTAWWKRELGDALLNADGTLLCAVDVRKRLEAGPLHVRPDSRDKAFNARLFDGATWEATLAERKLHEHLACWVSPPKEILREWRCWFVGNRLIEVSQYRANGQMALERSQDRAVEQVAWEVAQTWLPEPCVVMDIGETKDGLFVLEFNPIHSSGWYAADVDRVLSAWLSWSREHFGGENA